MNILLLHPDDSLQQGPWISSRWDRVIDLGRSGEASYARASDILGCPVLPFDSYRDGFSEIRKVRDLLAQGMGSLTDGFGLDWWELTSIFIHEQLESLVLLLRLVETFSATDQVHVSRPGVHASALRFLLGSRAHCFARLRHGSHGPRHYLRVFKKFPTHQLLEIFWDKADPGYQLRGSVGAKRRLSSVPLVLLPTAYVNVSRTGVAYAQALPEVQFLLVATRPSGWLQNVPANVSTAWLRSYASVRAPGRQAEFSEILRRWKSLRADLETVPEFRLLAHLGAFKDFPRRFALGLQIRDAWRNLLESEPVHAVICADDTNPYTHIPLLLAANRGFPTLACHHGAFDGRYMFKRNHADSILVKGGMEHDYLVRTCEVSKHQVEIGAPGPLPNRPRPGDAAHHDTRPFILFVSESYETFGGRGRDFYRDILPPLAALAQAEDRELVIKLHPAESLSERRAFVAQILSPEQQRITRLISGPLLPDLLANAWFALTVLSTVASECALSGVPCFLCKWLEFWPYGYIDQFMRFGVGIGLRHPAEIRDIPKFLAGYRPDPQVAKNCWQPIDPVRLRTLLRLGEASAMLAPAADREAQRP